MFGPFDSRPKFSVYGNLHTKEWSSKFLLEFFRYVPRPALKHVRDQGCGEGHENPSRMVEISSDRFHMAFLPFSLEGTLTFDSNLFESTFYRVPGSLSFYSSFDLRDTPCTVFDA